MSTLIGNATFIAVTLLFGLYEIAYVSIGAIKILLPWQTFQSWEILIGLVWIFGVTWKAWQKRIARKNRPVEWKKWEVILCERQYRKR